MNKIQFQNNNKLIISNSLNILSLINSQGLIENREGVTIRLSGRLKGPIAIKTHFKAGNIKTKTFNRVVRMTQDKVRTQVGIIGVRIITG